MPREHVAELAQFLEAHSKARERSSAAAPRPSPAPMLHAARAAASHPPDDALTRPRPFRAGAPQDTYPREFFSFGQ